MKPKTKLPTIIGILVLILGVGAGVLLVRYQKIFNLRASPDTTPQDVRITNITDNSFAVSWITDKPTVGFVKWGESADPDKTAPETDSTPKNIHQATVAGLTPGLTYYFKINSENQDFDNSGIPYQTKTGPTLPAPENTNIISGNVVTASGQPAQEVLVFVTAGGISPLSAKTSASGAWVIPIANARTSDLTTRPTTTANTLLEIYVQGASQGVATAQVYLAAANPVPQMVLGQTYDFRSEQPTTGSELPQSNLNLPEEATPSSGFTAGTTSPSPQAATAVTLESVVQGETISSTKPEFFGEGPKGVTITITVQSDPITDTVKVDSAGDWKWTPPTNLEPGTHTITLKWKDASGILRTLTRTFVVEASEGPTFVSTPSATPKTTPKPTATPRGSATPSATPRVTVPVSDTGTPVAGSLTPTFALSIMGIGLLAAAIIAAKKSFD